MAIREGGTKVPGEGSPTGWVRRARLGRRHCRAELPHVGSLRRFGSDPRSVRAPSRGPGPTALRCGGSAESEQFWRSAGHRTAPNMTAMDITIHQTFLPHDDPDVSLAFYRDTLGFEVRNDVGY